MFSLRTPRSRSPGVAATGKIALAKLDQINPDIVTLDMEMPEMDGLTTLREIRKVRRGLPVIMFSTLTQSGAAATINALTSGADDYVTKPANVGSVTEAIHQIREALIPKIKLLCARRLNPAGGPKRMPAAPQTPLQPYVKPRLPNLERRIDVLAIGTSTGGPNALNELLKGLPGNLPVPLVIVQHMPPMFTRMLAEHLTAKTPVRTTEAVHGDRLEAGHGWVAPGGRHMVVVRDGNDLRIRLNDEPPENSCRPSVDVLFRSIAAAYQDRALGVVLTGMGQDGMRGSEQLCRSGSAILAQDEASSVVWGMAGAVVHAGLAEAVLPLNQLSQLIIKKLHVGRPDWIPGQPPSPPPVQSNPLCSPCH
jgi:two-component system chemotaxis response regulator CheB